MCFLSQVCFFKTAYADIKKSYDAINTQNYPLALIEARKAADTGDPRGAYFLGLMFERGLGVEANAKQAFDWYLKAAQGGMVASASKIAMAYHLGNGVTQDKEKALAIAGSAGENFNDPHSQFLIYLFLTTNQISFLDSNGKPDSQKYKQRAPFLHVH